MFIMVMENQTRADNAGHHGDLIEEIRNFRFAVRFENDDQLPVRILGRDLTAARDDRIADCRKPIRARLYDKAGDVKVRAHAACSARSSYVSVIAAPGQVPTQAPHPVHLSGSISGFGGPPIRAGMLIAFSPHASLHDEQCIPACARQDAG